MYFAYFGGAKIKPRFFFGELSLIREAMPLTALATFNWFLQYLWMGMVFELGARQGISDSLVLIAIELGNCHIHDNPVRHQ